MLSLFRSQKHLPVMEKEPSRIFYILDLFHELLWGPREKKGDNKPRSGRMEHDGHSLSFTRREI